MLVIPKYTYYNSWHLHKPLIKNTAHSFTSSASNSKDFSSTYHRVKPAGLSSNLKQIVFCGSPKYEFNPPFIKLCFLGCLEGESLHTTETAYTFHQFQNNPGSNTGINCFRQPPFLQTTIYSPLFQ